MFQRERGVALVTGVVLMLVATVIGVSSMSQTALQTRSAGNQRAALNAFLAAEQGLISAKNTLDNDNVAHQTTGSFNSVTWIVTTTPSDCSSSAGCQITSTAVDESTNSRRVLTALYQPETPSGSLAPINIIGEIGIFDGGDSNSLQVTGAEGGPAIATNSAENVTDILAGIRADRLENFIGGVREVEFDNPFGDAASLERFIAETKNSINDSNRGSIVPRRNGGFNFNIGSPASPKITVYNQAANQNRVLEMTGNVSGAGILIVEGNLIFSGTPSFEGLIIVTGSSFTVSGGGQGGILGSIVFANPVNRGTEAEPDWAFGAANATFNFDVVGGGNAEFAYSAEALQMAQRLLNDSARQMWVPNNGGGQEPSKLLNWREITGDE